MSFEGKYKLKSSEHFDEYMKAVGVGMVTRKMANAATPVVEITINGDEYTLKTVTSFKTTEIKFKLGTEFEEKTADGRTVKTTFTKDGDKLIQVQKGEVDSTLTREFTPTEMKMTLVAKDVTCTRNYDRV